MEEETEFTKLPLEERCVHKAWKARIHGYEECKKKFGCIDDEKSPEWNKFSNLIKKFVIDSNAPAQEKGLEAALTFIENAACAGKTASEVMTGIVNKCVAAPKARTNDLAVQISLMYIEIEKHEVVQEELLKGTEAKNPKIVAACINTLKLALAEFGSKVINIKPLLKKIPAFLEDRDKTVREEGKAMVIEIYRWIGAPLKQQLNTLKPVQLAELETEFAKLTEKTAYPSRYLRSQKVKLTNALELASSGDADGMANDEDDEDIGGADIDPYEFIDPVDILSKLPKDFYEKVEAKKWQERKEALETLESLTKNPKLENGDYGDIVRTLKKIISKDSNVVVVTIAGKCLTGLATGLKKRFQPYALSCLSSILEKFREKKPTVVTVLREAADAIFMCISIDVILDDTLAALDNKNPSVKAETAAFIARCFANTSPVTLNKKLLKAYSGALLKTLNESDPTVRDQSAEALGMAMKLVGEKSMMPFLTDLDSLKMSKIQECAEKAIILVKSVGPRKLERPVTAPASSTANTAKLNNASGYDNSNGKLTKRPATTKKATLKKATGVTGTMTSISSKKIVSSKVQTERELSSESVDELAVEYLPNDVLTGLVDANWKSRLTAVEQLTDIIKQMDAADVPTQVIVRILGKKPGFKDTNFQVLKLRLELVKVLAENYLFSVTTSNYCITDIAEKLADVKNSTIASDTLIAIAEATNIEHVASEVITFAFNQKNPKVQQEALLWLSNALLEFGCVINVKNIIENVKKALSATNPGIRSAAITLLGTMYLYLGKPLLTFFENEKPLLKQQIEQECEKHTGKVPQEPKRMSKNRPMGIKSSEAADDFIENDDETPDNQVGESNDLLPRIDITPHITETLLAELADKNWKVRNEGLQKISNMISEAKYIKATIGDLPRALSLRLVDSNSKLTQTTLGICEALAIAMGTRAKPHIRTLFPGFIQCLGDSKIWIRSAAISCINTWGDQCGYKDFFDGEMIGDALKSGSPVLRTELWSWLAQKLPLIPLKQIPKEELMICLPYLYNNLEDRIADVRKNAQEAVLGFMIHLSYEVMLRHTEKLKPGSKTGVLACLEKTRPNLPIKPLPTKKSANEHLQKTVKSGGAMKATKVATCKGGKSISRPSSARKKDDDVDTSPLLAINNLKHQRVIDEQKLKVLKWNFTTPREEFVDLLKELMSTAGVNKTLISNMFHTDFRYHLKAIESLTDDLQDNRKALVSNLDLILKWLTLRFFDTNPSVLLKGLDYLQTVFNILIDDQYHMLENEAASFIPYLIIKIGDPKDSVRNGVRALFRQIAFVYPVSKLFVYVMDGLKSKNARQRTECLEQLGSLIENYGVSVCQPTPSAALREVAKQIADRDNSVRNAALNCIVQVYFLEGDRVNKLIGHISEKDQSLLEERIKRASKNRPTKSSYNNVRMSSAVPPAAVTPSINDDMESDLYNENEEDLTEEPNEQSVARTAKNCIMVNKMDKNGDEDAIIANGEIQKIPQSQDVDYIVGQTHASPPSRTKTPGPFGLDMDFLKKLEENAPARWKIPELIDINWDPNETVNTMNITTSNVIKVTPSDLITRSTRVSTLSSPTSKVDSLERSISAMASPNLSTALQALINMDAILKSSQVSMLQSKEDKFIDAINIQLKQLQTYPLNSDSAEIAKAFRTTFMVTLSFYESGLLGKNVPPNQLKELVHQMLILLAENKLESLNQADIYIRVMNIIVLKMIDHSNHTTIICVLIKLLHECAEMKVTPKYEELVMKCLWKIVKTISNWANILDYDAILYEVHQFFRDHPSSWWKKRHSDMPVRTVKTVLHSMTKVKGSAILGHLTKINTQESELRSYLNRLVESVSSGEITAPTKTMTKQKHLSKITHAELTEIFKKIGSKHQTQEGLAQLYDFKIQHPEADIQPFLNKSHQFFQEFIEQGLKDIDQIRKSHQSIASQQNYHYNTITQIPKQIPMTNSPEDKTTMDPIQRLEKLRALEAQYRANAPTQSNPT